MSKDFTEVTEALKSDLIQTVGSIIQGPVAQAVQQIQIISERKDLTEEQRLDMLNRLQRAMVEPFAAAAVSIALSTHMNLPTLLFVVGSAWDELRASMMSKLAEGMLNKGGGDASVEGT